MFRDVACRSRDARERRAEVGGAGGGLCCGAVGGSFEGFEGCGLVGCFEEGVAELGGGDAVYGGCGGGGEGCVELGLGVLVPVSDVEEGKGGEGGTYGGVFVLGKD